MREVKIDGLDKPVKLRSIKRSEQQAGGLDQYGYHLLFYSPPMKDGTIDREKAECGINQVMDTVLGAETVKAIDDAGGASALRKVWYAIVKETYGDKDEEKNLSPAGNSTPTPSGSPTVADAQ